MLSEILKKYEEKEYKIINQRINCLPKLPKPEFYLFKNELEIMNKLFEDKERTTLMQDLIEKIVTNGLRYRTQHLEDWVITDDVKNSEEGLQAHLAELETRTNYNSDIREIRDAYRNLLILLSRQENKNRKNI